ncbi:DivIVA domain-containing protein [Nostocoides jenkinsii]|uniref:DivIVA domain-containing protein n=1 Tax=Nostocoides jenkinsii Ben 74 TaxID=1193518 RepID=A0A077MCS4_9MICO|nr:DivIVA domain-containing protein [Tetrasphaera jenkinsii]CCI53670.1 exported hypothetical protein [Tetrasphaera jenkinsii Ben 74]
MIWILFLVVGVLVAAYFAALILGRAQYDPMPEPTHTQPLVRLPAEPTARDIDDLHFDTALRGYRMDQVDEVLDQLQARLAAYEHGAGAAEPGSRHLDPHRVSASTDQPDPPATDDVIA